MGRGEITYVRLRMVDAKLNVTTDEKCLGGLSPDECRLMCQYGGQFHKLDAQTFPAAPTAISTE